MRYLFFLLLLAGEAKGGTSVHWGVATLKSGEVAYTERHSVTERNGVLRSSLTEYFDGERKQKIGLLESDYSRSLSMPTYEFRDIRTGYREGLRFEKGRYVIFFQKPKQEEKAQPLKKGDSVFSCQGWHYYLIENLGVLEKQDIALKLVLPSELDFYSFKVRGSDSSGDQVVAYLELSNWLLSMFAPKLKLVYNKARKKLVEYQGVSNILDANGDRQDVIIRYEYGGSPVGESKG